MDEWNDISTIGILSITYKLKLVEDIRYSKLNAKLSSKYNYMDKLMFHNITSSKTS